MEQQRYRPRGQIQPKGRTHDEPPDELRGRGTQRPRTRPASEIKELVSFLSSFTMDELRQVPVVAPGAQLEQGATYVELTDDDRNELTALGGMTAEHGRYFVPKKETPVPYWNRIIRARPRIRRT
jgi:hypothetical protein